MKIKFLGVGSAFTMKSFNSNFIIEKNGKNLLIDAGTDMGGNTVTRARLAAQKKGSEMIKMNKLFARGSRNPDLTFTKARNSMYA